MHVSAGGIVAFISAPVEQMTFSVEPDGASGGRLVLSWSDRAYSASFVVRGNWQ
jgi:hypothetical protein